MLEFNNLAPTGTTVPPSLTFDFVNQVNRVGIDKTSFANALTFTRASPKWVFDASGTLVEVPVDQPAYDHDPVTGEPLGVLIEESRTNGIPWSEDFSTFALSGTSQVTINSHAAPDGTLTADTLSGATDTNRGGNNIYEAALGSYSNYATASVYVKSAGATTVEVALRDQANGLIARTSITCTDEWQRVFTTRPASGDNINMRMYIGAADGDVYIWGAQVEEASTASSYIPTAGAAVTRAADNMSRTLGAEFNGQEGTIFAELLNVNEGALLAGSFGSSSNRFFLMKSIFYAQRASGSPLSTQFSISPELAPGKVAIAYSEDGIEVYNNGVYKGAALYMPPLDTLYVGKRHPSGPDHINTHCFDYRYYPYAMTAAELEALTS